MVGQLTESALNFLFTKTATIWRPLANDNEVDAYNSTGYRGNFACIKSLCRGNKILVMVIQIAPEHSKFDIGLC